MTKKTIAEVSDVDATAQEYFGVPKAQEFFEQYRVDYQSLISRIAASCMFIRDKFKPEEEPSRLQIAQGRLDVICNALANDDRDEDGNYAEAGLFVQSYGFSDKNVRLKTAHDEKFRAEISEQVKQCRVCLNQLVSEDVVSKTLSAITPDPQIVIFENLGEQKALVEQKLGEPDDELMRVHNDTITMFQQARVAELQLTLLSVIDDAVYDLRLACNLIPDSRKVFSEVVKRNLPALFGEDPEAAIKAIETIANKISDIGDQRARTSGNKRKSNGKKKPNEDKYGKPIADSLLSETSVLRQYLDDVDRLEDYKIAEMPEETEESELPPPVPEPVAPAELPKPTVEQLKRSEAEKQSLQNERQLRADVTNFDRLYLVRQDKIPRLGLGPLLESLHELPGNPKVSKTGERKYDPMLLMGLLHRLSELKDNDEFYEDLLRYDELLARNSELGLAYAPVDIEKSLRMFKDKKVWNYVARAVQENWPNGKGTEMLAHFYEVLLLSKDELPNQEYLEYGPDGRPKPAEEAVEEDLVDIPAIPEGEDGGQENESEGDSEETYPELTDEQHQAALTLQKALEGTIGMSSNMTDVDSPDHEGGSGPGVEVVERVVNPNRALVTEWFDTAPPSTGIREVLPVGIDASGYQRRVINVGGVLHVLYENEVEGASYTFRVDMVVGDDGDVYKIKDAIDRLIGERKISVGNVQGLRDKPGMKYRSHHHPWDPEQHAMGLLDQMIEQDIEQGPDQIIQKIGDLSQILVISHEKPAE